MTDILHILTLPSAWLALVTLLFLEVVLGIDNVVFISLSTSRLPERQQPVARRVGLLLAMLARIGLLFGVSMLVQLTKPIFSYDTAWLHDELTWQSVIIFAGGLFLLWKSVSEIHHKLEKRPVGRHASRVRGAKFWTTIVQIVLLDIVMSIDSVLTAVGMVSFTEFGYAGAMAVMVSAIVIAVTVMLFFSTAVSRLVTRYPTIQMLALSFLLLIGVLLLMESAHLSHLKIFGHEVPAIPRGYVYFAIAFSLMVEIFNIRMSKRRRKKTIN